MNKDQKRNSKLARSSTLEWSGGKAQQSKDQDRTCANSKSVSCSRTICGTLASMDWTVHIALIAASIAR